jgi:hypothetical protein
MNDYPRSFWMCLGILLFTGVGWAAVQLYAVWRDIWQRKEDERA